MKKYLLAAVAAAAIASPAAARDHSGYVGLEGGFLFPTNNNVFVDASDSYYCDLGGVAAEAAAVDFSNCVGDFHTKYKTGYDVDVVAGYDFGMFRLEGELGYKRASHKHYSLGGESISSNGHTSAWSAMVNGLVDFGGDSGVNFSIGGGVGYAHTRYRFGIDDTTDSYFDPLSTTLSRSRFAWQLLAEARVPVSQQIDVGVKYRYFNAGRLRHTFDDGEGGTIFASTKFHSHSILASLIYNFAPPAPPPPGPPPPPPPPPPAPATQTCPDGSVIEATATCPLPPPPPPPPPPATSGERGQ